MIVCVCHGISDRHIAAQVRAGCMSFEELQMDTGVATRCGCCRECAEQTFELHRAQAASTSPHAAASLQPGIGAHG